MAKKKQEPEETVIPEANACAWVDDNKLLKSVTKINKEWCGNGNSKKWVNVYYGELID